jgi:hypothetical protein
MLAAMRALLLPTLFLLGMGLAARGDEQLIEQFDGHNSLTTSDFNVPDHWEIRWHSAQALSVGVIRLDNTVVAGATGLNNGSLYLPRGGTYRIRVKGDDPIPWDVTVVALGPAAYEATPGADSPFYVPTPGPDEATNAAAANPPPTLVETNAPPAPPPSPPQPVPPPTQLSEAQLRAIVVVKGDRDQGTGFLLKTATGPVVITSLRLISDNPNLGLATKDGAEIKIVSIQGAPDRDLAMIGIQDNAYSYLEPATNLTAAVQPGDVVLTTGSTPSAKASKVLSLDSQRLEIGEFQNHGDIGGPILLAGSGQAIAMVSAQPRVIMTTDLDKISFASRDATVAHSLSYCGLRLDTVPNWETYNWKRFCNETAFLDDFHQRSECLDSYLNSRSNDSRPRAKLYLSDDKIKAATETYAQESAGADSTQRNDSLRGLLFELGNVADTDMDQVQQPANFYSFDQQRAAQETAYRQALKTQLDFYGNNLNLFENVVRKHG